MEGDSLGEGGWKAWIAPTTVNYAGPLRTAAETLSSGEWRLIGVIAGEIGLAGGGGQGVMPRLRICSNRGWT